MYTEDCLNYGGIDSFAFSGILGIESMKGVDSMVSILAIPMMATKINISTEGFI